MGMAKKKSPKRGRPVTGRMPKLNVRLPTVELDRLNAKAAAKGETTSAYLRRLIRQDA